MFGVSLFTGVLVGCVVVVMASAVPKEVKIKNSHPLIHYHGRWDSSPGTWWAGSGFKINVQNLQSLSLDLGNLTSTPFAPVAVSVDNSDFFTVNATSGINVVPLPKPLYRFPTTVRINVEGWQNNRIHLQGLTLNSGAALVPYAPEKRVFQFIGDSLSSGQFLPLGVNQAWPFLVAESLKAEHRINAQPGATLTDRESYGNAHGVSFQFFKTEDTGYFWTGEHNFTTPWDFSRDKPAATHVVIHIGANDASHGILPEDFTKTYNEFLDRLRKIYPSQPFFIFTPWGWPHEDHTDYYYDGVYQSIVAGRKAKGDKKIFLVDTHDWLAFSDVFPDNVHPNVPGSANIAKKFVEWLTVRRLA